ncbi:ribonuclease H-like domain-containing protein, partial [Candidatus Saccharibacteria bacterium]|nr:ribonuclease H-like domain-containing protein [Candidatus Saccharibacteria bacterium]
MKYVIVDIETDGLLDELTKIHSVVIQDEEGRVYSCHDHGAEYTTEQGIKIIQQAVDKGALLVMHNGICFDIPAIKKVHPWFDVPVDQIRDTLVLSRLLWTDIKEYDGKRLRKGFPKELIGSHSLEAWGYRLNVLKGDFHKTADWSRWSPAMQEYCVQDVVVTAKLWQRILKEDPPARAVELETWFAYIIHQQEQFGYTFDRDKAVKLYTTLLTIRDEIDSQLKRMIKPWYVSQGTFVPKRDNNKTGYTAGAAFTK